MFVSYIFINFLRFRISLCLLFVLSFKKIDYIYPESWSLTSFMTPSSESPLVSFPKSIFSMSDKLFEFCLDCPRGTSLRSAISVCAPKAIFKIHWSDVIYVHIPRCLEMTSALFAQFLCSVFSFISLILVCDWFPGCLA